MGVVGGLGGEIPDGTPAAGVGMDAGTVRGVVMMVDVGGEAVDEESISCPPTGDCGGAGL